MRERNSYVLKVIPRYAVLPLIFSFTFNTIIYSGTQILCRSFKHYDLTLPFDRMIPVIPSFMSVYLGCYIFWVINYIMISRIGKGHMYRFLVGDYLSRVICGMFFVFFPTTLVRPEITGAGFWDQIMRMVYAIDGSVNLFPSIHCMVSWFCYIGIRRQKNIPVWYRGFSCVFALIVCVSTQVTKQHYIVDVAGGLILAETMYYLGQKTSWYLFVQGIFTRVNHFFRLEGICREQEYEK